MNVSINASVHVRFVEIFASDVALDPCFSRSNRIIEARVTMEKTSHTLLRQGGVFAKMCGTTIFCMITRCCKAVYSVESDYYFRTMKYTIWSKGCRSGVLELA